MLEIKFDVSELQEMADHYSHSEAIVKEEITTGMTRSVIAISKDAKEFVPVDKGVLRGSIHHTVQTSGTDIIGVAGSNLIYARPIEEGRLPGHQPPFAPLVDWAVRHGLPAAAGYAIAKNIGKNGQKARPFLQPAYEKNRAAISKELGSAVIQRIMKRMAGS